jgi:acyl carrier protein
MDREALFSKVRDTAAATLEVDPQAISEESDFRTDLKADSLEMVELSMLLEDELSVSIDESELGSIRTIGDVLDLLGTKLEKRVLVGTSKSDAEPVHGAS